MTNRISSEQFFNRALREASRYGDDPWVFLRELVQNSRDAGADRIDVTTHTANGETVVTCEDNGKGMTREHINRYLLRLYASSKEEEAGSVGFFGVGFWSVLLFHPCMLRITSTHGEQTFAIEINIKTQAITQIQPQTPLAQGTRIELFRPQPDQEADPAPLIQERLSYYARHVRPLNGAGQIELSCNRQSLNAPFPKPSGPSQFLKTDAVDGVIGFCEEPVVRLYKGGILVRDLITLDEVIPSRPIFLPRAHRGMHIAAHLNVESLNVLLDRRGIEENPDLHKVVDLCEDTLLELHHQLVHKLYPMNLKNRLFHLNQRLHLPLLGGLLLLSVMLGMYAALEITPIDKPSPRRPIPQIPVNRALESWSGVVIDQERPSDFRWQFTYDGPNYLLFGIKTFSIYDPVQGLISERPQNLGPFSPEYNPITGAAINVTLRVEPGQLPFMLPVPSDYTPIQSLLRGDNGDTLPVWTNQFGDPMVAPKKAGVYQYDITYVSPEVLTSGIMAGPMRPPAIVWPQPYADALTQARDMPAESAVHFLTNLVLANFKYTRDPGLAALHADTRTDWLEKTLESKAGDCDVLNGLLVLLLQSAGIRAQLVAGLVGYQGTALPELHAWGRYYNQGWIAFDITRNPNLITDSGTALPAPRQSPSQSPTANANRPNRATAPLPPAVTQPTPAAPLKPSAQKTQFRWWWLCPIALFLIAVVLWRRRRKSAVAQTQSDYLTQLFGQFLESGVDHDPLRLMFRPVFPTISGRTLSFHEVNRLADKGRLLGGAADSPLIPLLKDRSTVLDLNAPAVAALREFLPAPTWLDQAKPLLDPAAHTAQSQKLEEKLHLLDPDFRIHLIQGGDQLQELYLPLKAEPGGARHLLLGDRHPLWIQIADQLRTDTPYADFEAQRLLLEAVTFYLNEKDSFLAQVAQTVLSRREAP